MGDIVGDFCKVGLPAEGGIILVIEVGDQVGSDCVATDSSCSTGGDSSFPTGGDSSSYGVSSGWC